MPSEDRIVHVTISGRVQGVGYRAWTYEEALKRDLRGWVRNRANGSVEAVFAGTAEAVAEMCSACWQGPRLAAVTNVVIIDTDETALAAGGGRSFQFLATL
jgi:acylphosphatase